jgi:DNA-directed RNA polymerase subunit RPC12/RpoP
MALIALRCPQCGGEIQLENVREIGFCMYCGSKVVLQEAITKQVSIDESHKIEAWLALSYDALRSKNFIDEEGYANKIIEINFKNPDAWYIKGCCATDSQIALDQWNKALGYSEKSKPIWNTITTAKNNLIERKRSRNVTFIRGKDRIGKDLPFFIILNDVKQFDLGNRESRTIILEGGSYILNVKNVLGGFVVPPYSLNINKDITINIYLNRNKKIPMWEMTVN